MNEKIDAAVYRKRRILLKNGRFINVKDGCYFDPDVSLIIQDGRIVSMPGLPGERRGLETDHTVDLQGKAVAPGFFNTHCHLQIIGGLLGNADLRRRQVEKNLSDCLEYGVTNIRDAWSPDLQPNRDVIEKLGKGEMRGPRLYQSVVVSPFGGNCAPPLNPMNRMLFSFVDYDRRNAGCVAFRAEAGEREVRDAVNRAIDERGADYIKFYDNYQKFMSGKPGGVVMTDRQLSAAADQARSRGVATTIHHTKASLFRRDVAAGVDSLVHLPLDELLTEKDIAAFIAGNCFIEPTLSCSYALCWSIFSSRLKDYPQIAEVEGLRRNTIGKMLDEFWLPELASRHKKSYEKYIKGNFKAMGLFDFSAPSRRYTSGMPSVIENTRLLCINGAKDRIACGNDSTLNLYTEAAIHLELDILKMYTDNAESAPVDAADLLRMSTIQSAQAMKLEDRFGSVETGKTADLVLLDGDPLRDYHRIGSRAAAVFMDGALAVNHCGLQIL